LTCRITVFVIAPSSGSVSASRKNCTMTTAIRRGRERLHPQQGTVEVDGSRDMHIEVRVNTTDDRTRGLYDSSPSLLSLNQSRGGTHVPGRRPWTSRLLAQLARSPSGTGRASFRSRATYPPSTPRRWTHLVAVSILTGQSVWSLLSGFRVGGDGWGRYGAFGDSPTG
jgi:hypothetical protein